MSDELAQVLAAVIVAVAQIYASGPGRSPVFIYIWDFLARVCGMLAWALGRFSMQARLNYFAAVNAYGS